MRLVVDTDAFCKLGLAGLLDSAAEVLGVPMTEWVVLPALPHMLRRGRLRRTFGDDACESLLPVASQLRALGHLQSDYLDRLAAEPDVDPGEAQILAAAAEHGALVLTHDKRALRVVATLPEVAQALSGRVVVLESVLLLLCEQLGDDEVARAVQPIHDVDGMVRLCFSGGSSPRDGLLSYADSLKEEVRPLVLWGEEKEHR